MAKKKIKAGKTKTQAKENKYFYGALLTIAGLLVIGIAATLLFGNSGGTVSGAGGQNTGIQQEMENTYGDKWRDLGITRWQYDPQDTMFYIDQSQWSKISVDDAKKRMNEAGDDFGKIVKKNGGDPKKVYIMFHDSVNTNMMVGTYSGASGAAIQQ